MAKRIYNGAYQGERLRRVAFPMGGMGAGMVCLEGSGALSHVSLRHRPEVFNEPYWYAALAMKGAAPDGGTLARVLEGPVPSWKVFGQPGASNGLADRTYGLPRFASASFRARFPFGVVSLRDAALPVAVDITGWSPFVPGDADSASLPVAGLEYRLRNRSDRPLDLVFCFNVKNPMATKGDFVRGVVPAERGLVLYQEGTSEAPWEGGRFFVGTDAAGAVTDCAWFRGGWFDAQTLAWRAVETADCEARPPHAEGSPSPGGSLRVPVAVAPGGIATVRVLLAWHVPVSNVRHGGDAPLPAGAPQPPKTTYVPWYAGRFADLGQLVAHWFGEYGRLRRESLRFSRCLADTTLPPELAEAVSANLTILKSPTVLRQADGRLWGWEGCCDGSGCCHGTCTHVWNYAQALPHLFPALERSLRETEFNEGQDDRGHQNFRASLPIRPVDHGFHAAADGQLGGVLKVYREWRISGDAAWLRTLWPKVRKSLDYCIETWDPDRVGALVEPHHNTYDIEFWGADGMCTSFYVGALRAAVEIGDALGDDVRVYRELLEKGRACLRNRLFDGEYFVQRVQWKGLHASDPATVQTLVKTPPSPEARALLETEGPKYQYGTGCLSDGVLGAWLAAMCGVPGFLDPAQERSHLAAVYRHNFRPSLATHANPQRPTYAVGAEGGLLLCSWPKGGMPSLPFVYSNEVWTGIEYQVAGHLLLHGMVDEACAIVRACRDRYDGTVRNPFNEYECGHWYARALASYGLLQAYSGVRYDAVEKTLYLKPAVAGDFRVFLSTATGYGTVGVRDGEAFVRVVSGTIPVERIVR